MFALILLVVAEEGNGKGGALEDGRIVLGLREDNGKDIEEKVCRLVIGDEMTNPG